MLIFIYSSGKLIELHKESENEGWDDERNQNGHFLSKSCFNQGYYQRFFIEKEKLGKGFRGSVYLW